MISTPRTTKLTKKERISRAKRELESMNDKLRAEFEEIKELINNRITANIRELWKLGKRVKAIHDRENEYGANAVGRMAICLGHDQSVLYLSMRFYTFYSEEQVDDLLKLRSKFGGCAITWSHLAQLLRLHNVKERTKLQRRIFDEDLSPEETKEEVDKLEGPSGRAGVGGRPLKVPATSLALVSNVLNQSYFWERNYNNLWGQGNSIVKMVEDMPAEKVTPEFLKKLDESVAYMDRIHEEAVVMKEHLEEARKTALKKAEDLAKAQASDAVYNGAAKVRGRGEKKATSIN